MVRLLASADWFGVNSLEEGLELRGLGEKRPVLVMGHVPLSALSEAVAHDLDLTLYNLESLEALSRLDRERRRNGRPIRVHLKVETGTGRQGILPEAIEGFARRLQGLAGAELVGVCTHFANIEDTLNHGYAERQIGAVPAGPRNARGPGPRRRPWCTRPAPRRASCSPRPTTPGARGDRHLWAVAFAGDLPLRAARPPPGPRAQAGPRAGRRASPSSRTLPEGSFVGYGCTFRTTRATRLAVLPVGYADGYDRGLGNTAHVLVHGKRAAVIGG